MTNKLQNVVVKEVSLVPKGANAKKIYLRKAADTDEKDTKMTTENQDTTAADAVTLEKAQKDAADAQVALEKAAADRVALEAKVALLEKSAAESATAAAAEKVALEKAAADAAAKTVELEKALAVEKEAKEVGEAIAKAAAEYKNLPEKPEALGPLLRQVRKADAAAADAIEALLKKVDAVSKGALDAKGAATASETKTAWEEIEKRAKGLVIEKKATTFAAAVDRVLQDDKTLYAQYQAEKRS